VPTPVSPPRPPSATVYASFSARLRVVLFYLALLVLPVSLCIWTGAYLHRVQLHGLWFESDAQIARTGLGLLRLEMDRATTQLMESATLDPAPDTANPAVRGALAGDTVLALEPGASGLDAALYVPTEEGGIRRGRREVSEPVLTVLEGSIGYEAVIYLRGRRRAATDAGLGPDSLTNAVRRRLAVLTEGVPLTLRDRRGALVPMATSGQGTLPNVVIMTAPSRPRRSSLARPFALAAGSLAFLLLGLRLFTLGRLGGQFTTRESVWVERALTLVPLFIALTSLVLVVDRYHEDVDRDAVEDLSRGLVVARTMDPSAPAAQVRSVTGYHASVLADGELQASTLPASWIRAELPSRLGPPGPGVQSGRMEQEGISIAWAAESRADGTTLALTRFQDPTELRAFTMRIVGLGFVLILLVLLYPAASEAVARP